VGVEGQLVKVPVGGHLGVGHGCLRRELLALVQVELEPLVGVVRLVDLAVDLLADLDELGIGPDDVAVRPVLALEDRRLDGEGHGELRVGEEGGGVHPDEVPSGVRRREAARLGVVHVPGPGVVEDTQLVVVEPVEYEEVGVGVARPGHLDVGQLHRAVAALEPDLVPHRAVHAAHEGLSTVGHGGTRGEDGRGDHPHGHRVLGGVPVEYPDADVVGAVQEGVHVDLLGVHVGVGAGSYLHGPSIGAVDADTCRSGAGVEYHAQLEELSLGEEDPEPVLVFGVGASGLDGVLLLVPIVHVLGLVRSVTQAGIGGHGGREQERETEYREEQ
jgi:hypothetical protein